EERDASPERPRPRRLRPRQGLRRDRGRGAEGRAREAPRRAGPVRGRPTRVVRREVGLPEPDHARRPHTLDDVGARGPREGCEGRGSLRRGPPPRDGALLGRGGGVRLDGGSDGGRRGGGGAYIRFTGRRPLTSRSEFVAIRMTSTSHQIP